jgi:hypothetical protein
MAEKPILFSGDMVQAILAGKKTQTRRPARFVPFTDTKSCVYDGYNFYRYNAEHEVTYKARSMVKPGDTLWVREAFRGIHTIDGYKYSYKADFNNNGAKSYKWRPSIHMPREAARLFLRVTDVRVERVQKITEEEADTEGFTPALGKSKTLSVQDGMILRMFSGLERFADNWDSIYSKRGLGWGVNPWVWKISFEVVK